MALPCARRALRIRARTEPSFYAHSFLSGETYIRDLGIRGGGLRSCTDQ